MHKKNILYIGSSEISKVVLESLLEYDYIDIKGIVCQPDRLIINRKEKVLNKPIMKQYYELNTDLHKIPIFQPEKINKDLDFIENIKSMNLDFILVVSYGQIISKEILDIAPCINLHPSLLPKYRGATPIETSLLNGDELIGISTILMNEKMDEGDILNREIFLREDCQNYKEILNKIYLESKKLLINAINDYKNILPMKQNLEYVSYCKKLTKDDYKIDLNSDYKVILNKAFVFGETHGLVLDNGIKLFNINVLEILPTGEIGSFKFDKIKNILLINCSNCVLEIQLIQKPGKKIQNIKDFINGIKVNNILNV